MKTESDKNSQYHKSNTEISRVIIDYRQRENAKRDLMENMLKSNQFGFGPTEINGPILRNQVLSKSGTRQQHFTILKRNDLIDKSKVSKHIKLDQFL